MILAFSKMANRERPRDSREVRDVLFPWFERENSFSGTTRRPCGDIIQRGSRKRHSYALRHKNLHYRRRAFTGAWIETQKNANMSAVPRRAFTGTWVEMGRSGTLGCTLAGSKHWTLPPFQGRSPDGSLILGGALRDHRLFSVTTSWSGDCISDGFICCHCDPQRLPAMFTCHVRPKRTHPRLPAHVFPR